MFKIKYLALSCVFAAIVMLAAASIPTVSAKTEEAAFQTTLTYTCSYLNIQDRYGNILFEQDKDVIIQQNKDKVSHLKMSYIDMDGYYEQLYIKADVDYLKIAYIGNCSSLRIQTHDFEYDISTPNDISTKEFNMQIIKDDKNNLNVSSTEHVKDVSIQLKQNKYRTDKKGRTSLDPHASPEVCISAAVDKDISTFSLKNGIFAYSLGIPQALDVHIYTDYIEYGRLQTNFASTGYFSMKSDAIILTKHSTKLNWDTVAEATRYVIYKSDSVGKYKKIAVTKETFYHTTGTAKDQFMVKAQTKIKGKWKTIEKFKLVKE